MNPFASINSFEYDTKCIDFLHRCRLWSGMSIRDEIEREEV